MHTDIVELHAFYRSALGAMAQGLICARLNEAWGVGERLRIGGFGFTEPYLASFTQAERALAFAPAAQGVAHWPADGPGRVALVDETRWPVPDAFFDRIVIVHGLEEAGAPGRVLREAWRTLTDDGRIIIVAANRRGPWAMADSTPFAAGRPFLKGQLGRLLSETLFRPTAWSAALWFPPLRARFLLRGARAWERAGARFLPGFSGVILVEAAKEMLAPVARARTAPVFAPAAAAGLRPGRLNSRGRGG